MGSKIFLKNGHAANWETAVRYCLFHAVVLIAIGGLASGSENTGLTTLFTVAAGCFVVGVMIFSGCLGVLALTDIRILGAIVQIGVSCLIGWATLAWQFFDFASKPLTGDTSRVVADWLHHPPDLVPLHAHERLLLSQRQPVS